MDSPRRYAQTSVRLNFYLLSAFESTSWSILAFRRTPFSDLSFFFLCYSGSKCLTTSVFTMTAISIVAHPNILPAASGWGDLTEIPISSFRMCLSSPMQVQWYARKSLIDICGGKFRYVMETQQFLEPQGHWHQCAHFKKWGKWRASVSMFYRGNHNIPSFYLFIFTVIVGCRIARPFGVEPHVRHCSAIR